MSLAVKWLSVSPAQCQNHREVDLSLYQWLLFMVRSIITNSIAVAVYTQAFFGWSSSLWSPLSLTPTEHQIKVTHVFFPPSKVDYPCILPERDCAYVCARVSHCARVWILTTLLTLCDDWQAFCPEERASSGPPAAPVLLCSLGVL